MSTGFLQHICMPGSVTTSGGDDAAILHACSLHGTMLSWSAELGRRANEWKRTDPGIEVVLDEADALKERLRSLRAGSLSVLQAKARMWLADRPMNPRDELAASVIGDLLALACGGCIGRSKSRPLRQ